LSEEGEDLVWATETVDGALVNTATPFFNIRLLSEDGVIVVVVSHETGMGHVVPTTLCVPIESWGALVFDGTRQIIPAPLVAGLLAGSINALLPLTVELVVFAPFTWFRVGRRLFILPTDNDVEGDAVTSPAGCEEDVASSSATALVVEIWLIRKTSELSLCDCRTVIATTLERVDTTLPVLSRRVIFLADFSFGLELRLRCIADPVVCARCSGPFVSRSRDDLATFDRSFFLGFLVVDPIRFNKETMAELSMSAGGFRFTRVAEEELSTFCRSFPSSVDATTIFERTVAKSSPPFLISANAPIVLDRRIASGGVGSTR
jgi:hypothetical protein